MMRRCQFFFNVFGLELPEYLSCDQFADSKNPDICVGQKQMRDAYQRQLKPSEFSIDFFFHVFDQVDRSSATINMGKSVRLITINKISED